MNNNFTTVKNSDLTYEVRTYGCQMNTHDSERISGLLREAGYKPASADATADIIVFNTCAVRENAANRLYGNLSHLVEIKSKNPNMQVAVGGCLAQKDKEEIIKKSPVVDVVFGTNNVASLPILLDRARRNKQAEFEILDSLAGFASSLPAKREHAYAGWVSISVGCNNTCTFCIVPKLRGKEIDRRPGEILAEIRALVDEGVSEITLLGQNVNAYGSSFVDSAEKRERGAFAKLLRACGEIEGLKRVKFTSPHPADFTDDVIEAMADTPNISPQLHMPLQSGSDNILKAMRRSYRRKKFMNILNKVREVIPHAAITTDIIVGFPGETEEDFQQTLEVLAEARFMNAYTFQYSKRPGTPAATMDGQIPKEIVEDRFDRLLDLQEKIVEEESNKQIGTTVELLVTNEGRKNFMTSRMSGRSNDGRVVHFNPSGYETEIRPGDYVVTKVTSAAPHHLIADDVIISHEKTKAGDIFSAGKEVITKGRPISLGLPKIGKGISVLSSSSDSLCSGGC